MANNQLTIDDIPGEVLTLAFSRLPTESLLALNLVSKRFNKLAKEPLLWKHHCLQFKYWDEKHDIKAKASSAVAFDGWESLYQYRVVTDRKVTTILNSILADRTGCAGKYKQIADYGFDAKDTLLRHCQATEDMEDVLSRRYYARDILRHVQRSLAVKEWFLLKENPAGTTYERALVAFDLFMAQDVDIDFQSVRTHILLSHKLFLISLQVSEMLDTLAERFKMAVPHLQGLSFREQALALVTFLRSENLVGDDSEAGYRRLENSFFGMALLHEPHNSTPLISTAIFCSIATRIGLDARPCGFPFHVHTIVYPPTSSSLDQNTRATMLVRSPSLDQELMYLDPFRSDKEVSIKDLQEQLEEMKINPADHKNHLVPSGLLSMILRSSRNIVTACQADDNWSTYQADGLPRAVTLTTAICAARWAAMLAGNVEEYSTGGLLNPFLKSLVREFRRDVFLLEEQMIPRLGGLGQGQIREKMLEVATFMHVNEDHPFDNFGNHSSDFQALQLVPDQNFGPHLKERVAVSGVKFNFRAGQAIFLRRGACNGVIISVGVLSSRRPAYARQPNGPEVQQLYAVLTDIGPLALRIVREDFIDLLTENTPRLDVVAGRYCDRWDNESKMYILSDPDL
ncbi:MAG: hypothetical protein M1829_004839 [Trizodia sp. TS-e1964]|nr:MAG: hypothetical protein M1829_004839 [Trizodia sp. TS-e1964]